MPRAVRLNVLDLLITFPGGREPRLNANRAICAVPLPPFMRIYSEFAFEHTIARQSCAALILPSATANLFPFFERKTFLHVGGRHWGAIETLECLVVGASLQKANQDAERTPPIKRE